MAVHLERSAEAVRETTALVERLGGPAGPAAVLADLDRRARPARLPRLLGRAVSTAYRFDAADQRDTRWWPQGVTTSDAADPSGAVTDRNLLVTTWYSREVDGAGHGSRVTFLDLDTLAYRHVLLVVPRIDDDGTPGWEPLHVHAGGLAWCGPWLHVAATARGFVSASVADVVRVPDHLLEAAYGHRFVLPVRLRHEGYAETPATRFRWSFLSLDRSSDPPALVAGEYGRGAMSTRLARFELDPRTWLPVLDADACAVPTELHLHGVGQMQGDAVVGGTHHITASWGPWLPGSVHTGVPGSLRKHRLATPMGPEDLTWSASSDLLWTVTEHPHRRWLCAMPRARFVP